MLEVTPYEVEEFSGGVTDFFIDGPQNACQYMENLLLTPNRKPTTRYGINYFVDEQVNATATRLHVLNHMEEPLVIQGVRAWYKSSATAFTQLYGPNAGGSTDAALNQAGVSATCITSHASWKGHTYVTTDDTVFPVKFYKDSTSAWKVRNAGLPAPIALSGVSSVPGSTKSYIYALVFKYTYEVGSETHEDMSAPFLYTKTSTNAIGTDTITLTLPGFSGWGENWDAANVKQEIYRTINNGVDFYLITGGGDLAYNDVSQADTTTDATLLLNEPLYINGGELDNDQPPKCKYVHIMGDTGYYGYTKDSAGTYAYQVRQSKQGDVDSVPGGNNVDLPDTVVGISSNNNKVIVACTNQVFRLEGSFDIYGQGNIQHVQISSSAGCIGHNTMVQTPQGVVWFGQDGVYITEGYAVYKISPHLDESYKNLIENATKRKRIQGTYHADLQCVCWAVSRTNGDSENDTVMVLDLRWGLRLQALDVKQTVATFYYWAGTTFSGLRYINRQLQLGTSTGYLHFFDPETTVDLRFAATADPSTWNTSAIVFLWTSTATDFGSKFMRKWVPWFAVSCTSSSNLSLAIQSIIDNGKRVASLKPIRYRGNIIWGTTDVFWGSPDYIWGNTGTLDYKRRMPSSSLRSMHRQMSLSNSYSVILTSDTLGTVGVTYATKAVVLDGTLTWPSNFPDYYISFSNDDYVREFLISTISTNTLVFADPNSLSPANGTYSFVVRGYPKGEVLNLNGVQMWWQFISKTLDAFNHVETGEPS